MPEAAAFIRAETAIASPTLVPEIKLHLATEITPLWQATEASMKAGHLPPPFWAFAWPGGQGVARYILDHPETVRGKRVLDFASGSGMAAIAAMKAGAKRVTAIDIDPFAQEAMRLNATLNGVMFEIEQTITMEKPPKNIDLILAGDICYEQALATRTLRWLYLCVAAGIEVIMGDPGRAYVPESGLTELASYIVPTTQEVEGEDSRTAKVWKVGLPVEPG